MSDQPSLKAIEKLQLILNVDGGRVSTDPFKLPTAGGATSLNGTCSSRLSTLLARCAATGMAAATEAQGQANFRTAADKLEAAHRLGWHWIDGQMPDSVPQLDPAQPPNMSLAQRQALMEAYLFAGGNMVDFNDEKVLHLARQVPTALAFTVPNPLWHYPQSLVDHIATQLAIAESSQIAATGGDTSVAIDLRDEARELGEDIISRVRHHYCGASDDGDRTPELRKIGMQPRRLPGEAGSGTVPAAPGTAVYDAATKTLTIPGLPDDSLSIRAYRKQLPDGDPVLCGVSIGAVVSIVQASPLLVADYEVWVVGFDGEDEGPESNRIIVDHTP